MLIIRVTRKSQISELRYYFAPVQEIDEGMLVKYAGLTSKMVGNSVFQSGCAPAWV